MSDTQVLVSYFHRTFPVIFGAMRKVRILSERMDWVPPLSRSNTLQIVLNFAFVNLSKGRKKYFMWETTLSVLTNLLKVENHK